MDIKRILERYDRLMDDHSFDEAEKHLYYWLNEAGELGDIRGKFTLLNEMVGFFRMRKKQQECFKSITDLIETLEGLRLGEFDISRGTAYLNIATAYNSFSEQSQALELYSKALKIYTESLDEYDERVAALYNNMAMAMISYCDRVQKDLKRTSDCMGDTDISDEGIFGISVFSLDKAGEYLHKALNILEENDNSENEQAITYLNLAELEEKSSGLEAGETKILEYVEQACGMLDKSYEKHNHDFKQTAEKCCPIIRRYGYFAYANILVERTENYNF